MFSLPPFKAIFDRGQAGPPAASLAACPPGAHGKCLDVVANDPLWVTHREIVATALCLSDERYARIVEPGLRSLANLVGDLPATRHGFYSAERGLYALCTRLAAMAARKASQTEFSSDGIATDIEKRRREWLPWSLAAFYAGLLFDVHRVLTHVSLVKTSGGEVVTWMPLVEDWVTFTRGANIKLLWRGAPDVDEAQRSVSLSLAARVIPPAAWQVMDLGGRDVVLTLLRAMSPQQATQPSRLSQMLVGIRESVIQADLATQVERYGTRGHGSEFGPVVIDALRRVYASSGVNRVDSVLWYTQSGIYLLFPEGAERVRNELAATPWLQWEAVGIAELLASTGVLDRPAERDGWAHSLSLPHGTRDALKFTSLHVLLPDPHTVNIAPIACGVSPRHTGGVGAARMSAPVEPVRPRPHGREFMQQPARGAADHDGSTSEVPDATADAAARWRALVSLMRGAGCRRVLQGLFDENGLSLRHPVGLLPSGRVAVAAAWLNLPTALHRVVAEMHTDGALRTQNPLAMVTWPDGSQSSGYELCASLSSVIAPFVPRCGAESTTSDT